MGDRGNIVLTGKDCFPHRVYLYTHWGGFDRKAILARALEKGRERWGDPSYLARVIFQELLGNNDALTGFGISTEATDNEYPFLVVDLTAKTVWEEADTRKHFNIALQHDSIRKPISFEDFLADQSVKRI